MEKYRQQMFDNLLKILSYDCVEGAAEADAPFGRGNRDCLDYTLSLCNHLGFTVKNLDGYCGYAEVGDGKPFGILGHLDTVPVDNNWTKNPLGEISDGVIYGRGVMDDKGPMLACVYAVRALLDEGLTPKRKIRLIFGCNEESGWRCIEHYNKFEVMPDEGFSPDADFPVINCEKGIATLCYEKQYCGTAKLCGGTRANVVPADCTAILPFSDKLIKIAIENNFDYRVEKDKIIMHAVGKASHAATPRLGINAVIRMLKALREIEPDFKQLYDAFSQIDGSGAGLKLSDDISGDLTLNLGVIECADKLKISLNIRYPVTVPDMQIINALDGCIPNYIVTKSVFQPPLYVDKDDELVKTLLSTYNDITGSDCTPVTIGGGTYARALSHGVAFGPEFPHVRSTIHMPDECCTVDNFMKMAEIYKEAIKRLCF